MNRLLWFLGTASLNYGVVTRLLGTLLLAVTFAVGPNLWAMTGASVETDRNECEPKKS
jgi:hypothetical protein